MKKLSKTFSIDGRVIGENSPCYIIAEAGVAHFGDYEKALRLVDLAQESGADCVKFQVFDLDAMFAVEASDWRDRLSTRFLRYSEFEKVKQYCSDQGITFLATAHDEKSLEFLSQIDLPAYKIGSGELGNLSYIRKVSDFGKPIILSTGMYTMSDVRNTLDVITQRGNLDVAVLHCVTSYPTPPDEVNLSVINLYKREFDGIIGFSDHTEGYHIPLASVALGSKIVEKHISLDFNVPNAQDWKVSCGPHNLRHFVKGVRDVEKSLGLEKKEPSATEVDNMLWARKSLVTTRSLSAGEKIRKGDIASKRPGNGISPEMTEEVLNKIVRVNIPSNSLIQWEDLE